ncbi:heterokaryon incompatibility protein-domain-containing protein [Colletotrichum phormii]|uniref:Heterokaryon incompatibility protein-domain-containing protein n=1 Tax=Colletotrichum phormii TaxID=359342 RepID=A0AAJ0EBU0_9PEZI|nr:heterokaryon incompatibility protein-domain-containing protein [Colletotrichum phormii]KAK1624048.1 heterokaryon incompatibility protein-domain-containing protein [Colletotrichum phormii]
MEHRCAPCASLTIEALIELAQVEFQAHAFPKEAFYRHHESFDALEEAARDGCDLCQLILKCFIHTPCDVPGPLEWPREWDVDLCPLEEGQQRSMHSIAKQLQPSDIKLSINATHLYGRQLIDEALVFDEIMVQVGAPYMDDDDGYDIWGCPVLLLTLSTSGDTSPRIAGFRIGHFETDEDLGSCRNHMLARQWLTDCRNSHKNCLLSQEHDLPTRVIDVGEFLDSEDVRLTLTKGAKGHYVALSHCWGGAISPPLTAETLGPFQDSITVTTLAQNFQDAIAITRHLGLRFLWIDCLCIQQDSKSDWENESKRMGLVYRNSTVTISAMVSAGSKDGILGSSHTDSPKSKRATINIWNRQYNQVVTIRRKDPNGEDLRGLDLNSALQTRGWTLQEYMLSPRHILYGRSMIYWRCPHHFVSPDGLPFGNRSPQSAYKDLSQVLHSGVLASSPPGPSETNVILCDYYELVNAYSQRKLTYGSDKLPAFSGIAQRLHPVIGGDYLAGLWTSDFRRGLLWTREGNFCHHERDNYRAPSWSWAVTDDMLLFEESTILGSSPSSAQLLEYIVHPRVPDNPFGEILFAKLVLKALTMPLVRSRQIISTYHETATIGHADFDEPAGAEDMVKMGHPSLFSIKADDGPYVVSIVTGPGNESDWELDTAVYRDDKYTLMLVHTDDTSEEEPGWSKSETLCLIIQQTTDKADETYERVGFARIHRPKLAWLKTWDWQVLTLV